MLSTSRWAIYFEMNVISLLYYHFRSYHLFLLLKPKARASAMVISWLLSQQQWLTESLGSFSWPKSSRQRGCVDCDQQKEDTLGSSLISGDAQGYWLPQIQAMEQSLKVKESVQKYVDILPLRRILVEDKWPQWVLVYVCVRVCVSTHTHACAVVCEFKWHNLHIAIDFSEPTYLETTSYSPPSEMTFS